MQPEPAVDKGLRDTPDGQGCHGLQEPARAAALEHPRERRAVLLQEPGAE